MKPFWSGDGITLYQCDVLAGLHQLADASVQCVVTSPPYWGLRDYGVDGQLGLEPTPEEYLEKMVAVFREIKRALKPDGTLWLNLGDAYANDGKFGGETGGKQHYLGEANRKRNGRQKRHTGLKPKDLIGIPWRVAFALQADGWFLRSDIIWSKPNPMPESVRDRPTRAHEYIFLLTKSARYYYDADAIKEPGVSVGAYKTPDGWDTSKGNGGHGSFHKEGREKGKVPAHLNFRRNGNSEPERPGQTHAQKREDRPDTVPDFKKNKRSVWEVTTSPYPEAHFATFPPKLIEPCILAGTKPGDVVLEPFWGSGTTGQVARHHGRRCIGIELNAEYCEMSLKRFQQSVLNFLDE